MNEPTAWERMLNKAERERDELRAEVERLRSAGIDWMRRCEQLTEVARDVVAERDALQRQVDAVRVLADEWVKTRDYLRKRGPAGSTRPDQSADRREANALDAAAASVFAALDAVEPADQPHPTPEADQR